MTQHPCLETTKLTPLIQKVLSEVVEDISADETVFARYFSPKYRQYVDGKEFDYQDFVQHMLHQKTVLQSAKITIMHCVEEGNKVCTVHRVDAIKKNGQKIAIKVVAYFEFEGDKIILCDELTHLLEGDHADRNIGSDK